MQKEKVSIVTVTFNCVSILEDTINSVINQTYPNIEYILIDGGSSDGTLNIIRKYNSLISYFISEPDKGIFDAMNKALRVSTGDWIIFMNAGDSFVDSNVLSSIFSRNYAGISVIYGKTNFILKNCIFQGKRPITFFEKQSFIKPMGICHQSILVASSAITNIEFDLRYKITADYKMMKNIYDNGGRFFYVDVSISLINAIDGLSANNRIQQLYEVGKICGIEKKYKFKVIYLYKLIKHNIKKYLN